MTIYLYVKTHQITGLKYLGKTKSTDPYKYKGSGTYWKRHLKVHGYICDTIILCECQTEEEITKLGLYYSKLWNVVESKEWANLKDEASQGGNLSAETKAKIGESHRGKQLTKDSIDKRTASRQGYSHSDDTRRKISQTQTGKIVSDETRRKISDANKGKRNPACTDETRQKLSNAGKGRPKTDDQKRKLSNSQKGRHRLPFTDEHLHNIRIAAKIRGDRIREANIAKRNAMNSNT